MKFIMSLMLWKPMWRLLANLSNGIFPKSYPRRLFFIWSSKLDLSLGSFEFGELGKSDEDEVFEPNNDMSRYMSSSGGGQQLEADDFDFSDGYEAHVYDLPGQLDAFFDQFDIRLKNRVQVETVLIESDMEAKAILDLIPILNIRKLVLGATKSSIRKLKSSSKRGSGGGTLDQIVHNAPQFCEVKVICEGKEVSLQDQLTSEPPSPSSTAPSQRDINVDSHKTMRAQQDKTIGFVNFSCFKL
ncbi:rossmann-like alpha/beta/alpha sandwich fold protein [Artemisia annua]|uniref:Rossmann-like alpha/beta/alpha sandwich fold protein n=1 Tax=Artemisia annua TaxID=35608 RepID=A0A2U1N3L3_ARTAN|nr:rossmann-like alpha/beta/alpha sandwich fold protein [Artemisia annua]